MLYASYHPERIEAMFLQSPACIENETREGWVYDPYSLRIQDQTDEIVTRAEVDKGMAEFEAG